MYESLVIMTGNVSAQEKCALERFSTASRDFWERQSPISNCCSIRK